MVTSGFFRGARFKPESDIPDLDGQVYIVTGASAGIGFGIAAQLLQRNASKIIILSSGEERGKKAIEDLKAFGDASTRARFVKCNLSDLKDTDRVAKSLRDSEPRIDGLILNAGIGVAKYSLSKDGIDNHSQINWLSQLHLALILLPTLRRTRDTTGVSSRMVLMSSEMHRFAPKSTEFANLDELNTDIGGTQLYARSKLAQILLVRQLVERMDRGEFGFDNGKDPNQAVLINATHPGGVKTPQQEALKGAYGAFWYGIVDAVIRPFMVDPVAVGCRSGLFAGTNNNDFMEQRLQGKYIVPDKKVMAPTEQAQDDEMAQRLWKLSIKLLRERLGTLDYDFKLES